MIGLLGKVSFCCNRSEKRKKAGLVTKIRLRLCATRRLVSKLRLLCGLLPKEPSKKKTERVGRLTKKEIPRTQRCGSTKGFVTAGLFTDFRLLFDHRHYASLDQPPPRFHPFLFISLSLTLFVILPFILAF